MLSLSHRGPDNVGTYVSGTAAIGYTHLGIIDLSENANQPLENETGSIRIVCDGRVYNAEELKSILIKRGHLFKTRTDIEVILHGYEEWGLDCIDKLDGSFAFVIWDEFNERIIAARDRFGEKPLFYSMINNVFYFSSEIAPLLQVLPGQREMDPVGLDLYLSYLYILPPYTIYKDIKQLSAASYLAVDRSGYLEINKYWQLSFSKQSQQSEDSIIFELKSLITSAIEKRLRSDVPFGALLSGGIDSAVVVAAMREISNQEIDTFTIGTTDPNMDETDRASIIAKKFGTKHHVFKVEPNASEILPKLIKHYGQPYADSSAIPTYYVSALAREYVNVVLTGDAGDHIFGGFRYRYAWFLQQLKGYPRQLRILLSETTNLLNHYPPNKFTQRLANIDKYVRLTESEVFATSYSLGFIHHKQNLYNSSFTEKLNTDNAIRYYKQIYNSGDGPSLLDRWMSADISTMLTGDVLNKVDIASMSRSLEMRAPFLDRKLADFSGKIPALMKIPGGKQKALIRKAYKDILPASTLNHRKTGFSVPVHHWLKNDLSVYIDRLILEGKSEILETYLNVTAVKDIIIRQRKGDYTLTSQVWALFNLVLWEKMFFRNKYSSTISSMNDFL